MKTKLWRGNLRKMLRDYLLYFLTLALSSGLFYAFLSLSSGYNDILQGNGNYALTLFEQIIRYAVLMISGIYVALIRYIHGYMLKERGQELAIYRILGMERRRVAGQFLGETLMLGLAAVSVGCLLGVGMSAVLTAFVQKMIGTDAAFRIILCPDTMGVTVLFFGAAFILVGVLDAYKITQTPLVDLLEEKRVNEMAQQTGRYPAFYWLLTIACLSIVVVMLVQFTKTNGIYAGDVPAPISNRYQLVAIIAAVVGIGTFYKGLLYVLNGVRKHSHWTESGLRSVFLGNFLQNVSATARVLSMTTLALTISLVAFVVLPILAEISLGYLDYRMPYAVMINNNYRYIDRLDDIPDIDYTFVTDILSEHGVTVTAEVMQKSYFVWERDFNTVATRAYWNDLPRLAMGISQYNQMRTMAGWPTVSLDENSFFMHLDYEMDKESIAQSLTTNSLRLDDGTTLSLAKTAIYNEPLGRYLFGGDKSILVFPDDVCQRLHLARTCYYAQTETVIPYELCDSLRMAIAQSFQNHYGYLFSQYETKYQMDKHYVSFLEPIRFWTQENNDTVLTAVSVRLLGIYAGVLFFLICMAVLALHLVTDFSGKKQQYRTLYRLGASRESIVRLAAWQNRCYFFVPCLVAVGMAILLIVSFILRYGYKVSAYMSTLGFQFAVAIPVLLMVIILAGYYGAAVYILGKNLQNLLDNPQ